MTDLRDYFRKPGAGGFWDDHVKRYSKSRRKAPIYWLLQSSKKNYALWIYYHRLDKDILFKALLNYVEPKIRRKESRLDELRSQKTALGPAAKGAKKLDKDIDRQDALPHRTPGVRGQAPQGGESPPRPRPQRRRRPEHRPALGTRPLEGGQVLLGRPDGRQVRVVVDRQAVAGERIGQVLKSIKLQGVGPVRNLTALFGERLNIITGDNGMGKSFLLDVCFGLSPGPGLAVRSRCLTLSRRLRRSATARKSDQPLASNFGGRDRLDPGAIEV